MLNGRGASVDTTTASGKLVFGFFAAPAEFEREPIMERTRAGITAARVRSCSGVRLYEILAAKLRLAMTEMGELDKTKVIQRCTGLGIIRQMPYPHAGSAGSIRPDGRNCYGPKDMT